MIGLPKSKRNRIFANAVKAQLPSTVTPSAKVFLQFLPMFQDELEDVIEEVKAQGDDHDVFKILRGEK